MIVTAYGLAAVVPLPPTADAGPDQAIRAGDVVMLDGSASFDDNTATANLLYAWSLDSLPSGSSAVLNDANTATPTFLADVAGTFLISLIVTDTDGASSPPDYVEIGTNNLPPTANAGPDQLVVIGDLTSVDGSASTDPESNPLTYDWQITGAPAGSTATLSTNVNVQTSLTPDLAGDYILTLGVRDFIGPGVPDAVTITATTPEDVAQIVIVEAYDDLLALLNDEVTNSGTQQALSNFLLQAIKAVQKGNIATAIAKLDSAIARTDGCPLRGTPDLNGPGRDWITDCTAQQTSYDTLTHARDVLAAI